jgi:uncharacterized protein (DUF433 family)
MPPGPAPRSLEIRLWETLTIGAPDECWPSTNKPNANGYCFIGVGSVWNGTYRSLRAHRVAYCLDRGIDPLTFPSTTVVRHRCDNPPCCNPRHLEEGSHQQNVADRQARGRTPNGERHWSAKFTWATVQQIREAWVAGASAVSLANQYGTKERRIREIVSYHIWRGGPTELRDACLARRKMPTQRKLTLKLVQEIRARHAAGARSAHLARSYGVNATTITHIVTYRTWKDEIKAVQCAV